MFKLKSLVRLFIILLFGFLIYKQYGNDLSNKYERWVNFSFCDKPIVYKIDKIDPIFKLSESDLYTAINDAALIWKYEDKVLFEKSENGSEEKNILKISLVNDGRHSIVNEISNLNNNVTEEKNDLVNNTQRFEQLKISLENEINKLNSEIEYWNNKGGAPKKEYNKLKQKQIELQQKIIEINKMGNKINSEAVVFNAKVTHLNENIETFNSLLDIRPEMGIYTSGINEIEIYFFATDNELIHVLAHEMGHALGLGHIEDTNSIMDPITSDSITLSEKDKIELTDHCQNRNRLELIKNDLNNSIFKFMGTLNDKLKK